MIFTPEIFDSETSSQQSEQQEQTEYYEEPSGTDEQRREEREQVPLIVETQPTTDAVQLETLEPLEGNIEEIKVVDASNNVVAQVEQEGDSIDRLENYDLSEPRMPSLIERLGQYAIVNNALTTYINLKNSNGYLGAGLTQAENATAVALAYTAPVVLPTVQPILNSLDARFGVEQKAHHLLDTLEGQVANASQAISTTSNYIENKKTATQNLVTDLQHRSYTLLIDRPVEQLLEAIETLVDRLLPPNFEVERLRIPEAEAREGEGNLSKYERICTIGYQVPKRIVNLAQQKYPQLHLTEDQLQKFAFLVDLVQYAVDQIDLAGKRARAAQIIATAQETVAENRNKVETQLQDLAQAIRQKGEGVQAGYVSPIRNAIDARLADIKDSELLSYAGVMAAIAHASELAKRQLYMRLGDTQNLMGELNAYLDSSKKMVLSFDKNQLNAYVATVRTNAVQTLSHILTLIASYAPKELVDKLPSYQEFSQNLDQWKETILQRLAVIQAQNTAELEAKNTTNDAPVDATQGKEGVATSGESQ